MEQGDDKNRYKTEQEWKDYRRIEKIIKIKESENWQHRVEQLIQNCTPTTQDSLSRLFKLKKKNSYWKPIAMGFEVELVYMWENEFAPIQPEKDNNMSVSLPSQSYEERKARPPKMTRTWW